MSEKFIAIGDIHGCPDQLREILEMIEKYDDHKIIFLGDYIDRGPDSEMVINIIRKLDAVFLLGNHEEMLLERIKNWNNEVYGDSFMSTKLTKSSVEWLSSHLVPVYESEEYIFVHAGLDKKKELDEQTKHEYLWTREDGSYEEITSKIVIHGHTIKKEPEIVGNRINLNTGCGSKGPLTALIVPEMEFIKSTNSPGIKMDWVKLKKELEEELKQYEEFAILEELE